MSPTAVKNLEALQKFRFERVLNEGTCFVGSLLTQLTRPACTDPVAHSLTLLGTFPSAEEDGTWSQAIVRVEKSALPAQKASILVSHCIRNVQLMETTDIVRLYEVYAVAVADGLSVV